MATVTQVSALFRQYIDETDDSWLENNIPVYLRFGYAQMRRMAQQADPYALAIEAPPISLTNAMQYDLSLTTNPVRLLGNPLAGLTGPRLQKILQVQSFNVDGTVKYMWKGVGSIRELRRYSWAGGQVSGGYGPAQYFLQGNLILFAAQITEPNFTITYFPEDTVDWTKNGQSDNEYIDNFGDFADLIALLAYQQYAIRDGINNPGVLAATQDRKAEFNAYLATGRDVPGHDHVVREY